MLLYYEHMASPWTLVLAETPETEERRENPYLCRTQGERSEWALVDERGDDGLRVGLARRRCPVRRRRRRSHRETTTRSEGYICGWLRVELVYPPPRRRRAVVWRVLLCVSECGGRGTPLPTIIPQVAQHTGRV